MKNKRASGSGKDNNVLTLIKKYSLKPITTRNTSIFTASAVAEGYVFLLAEEGLGHKAVGASTEGNKTIFYLNISNVNYQMRRILKSMGVSEFLDKYKKLLEKSRKELNKGHYLSYAEYFQAMGAIKSLARYIDTTNKFLEYHDEIGSLFNKIAETYTYVDQKLPPSIKKLTLQEYRSKVQISESRRKFSFVLDGKYHTSPKIIPLEKVELKEVKGRGFGKGIIKGIVSTTPKKDHILVTSMTEPAIPVSKVKAIITDEGGILCHAAITCRELGIPGVIGTKHATKIFNEGDFVELDVNKGIVRRIKKL